MTVEKDRDTRGNKEPRGADNDRVRALRKLYHHRLPERIQRIEKYWKLIRDGKRDQETLISLHRSVHSLAGSAVTFGFDDIGRTAHTLEMICIRLLETQDDRPPDSPEQFAQLIEQIKEMANNPVDDREISI